MRSLEEIKNEIKEEYVEPVKTEPLEIKREDVKEEYVETEVPDFQKLLRKPGDQIIAKPFEPEEAALTTTCEHCEMNFDDVSGLERHLKNHHGAKKSIECPHCDETFLKQAGLDYHVQVNHPNEAKNKQKKKKNHRAEKSIECPHCDETFLKQAGLYYHVQVNHPSEAKNKQAPVLVPLRQTELYHNKKNANEEAKKKENAGPGPLEKAILSMPWKCPVCGANLSTSGNLWNHMKIHKGDKTHKCEQCGYACSHPARLKRHMKTHSGEFSHKCAQCDFACHEAHNLKKHMEIHNGHTNVPCVITHVMELAI